MELYKDKNQPVEKRVEDLLSRMTLEEKAAQLCGDLAAAFIVDGKINMDILREKFPHGHGRFTQYSLVGLISPEQIARTSNMIQDYFVKETRLGIPVALQTENLCGYPAAGGTLFPAMINLGCSWEPELAGEMSAIIGQESRSVGITSAMSPVIDVSRDPRWGRTYETYGEDPYLISQFGVEYVRAMQAQGVSCIAKHFLGYAETQGGLNTAAARINDRELYETFATPFEAADKLAGLGGMMANYGEIDGLPVITNPRIARTLLRDTMGFEGMLTSDGAAVLKLFNYYKLSKTYEEAGLLAKKGGCDTEIPVGAAFRSLPNYVRSGELDEAALDESVRRILKIKFDMGLFENPYCDEGKVSVAMNNPEKSALSEKIAAKSADAVVLALGGNSGWVNVTGGEGKDRQVLDLPGVQQQLLEAVAAVGKPVAVVLYGPGVFAVNWAQENASAILQAFMPGQYAGKVVADVLYGDVNPGGKLTMSVPRGAGQIPIYYNHKNGSGYQSGGDTASGTSIFSGGYVDGPADPLYRFGHGLSYTTFELSDLTLSAKELPAEGVLEVSCAVKNTGAVAGDEVVQLYTSFFGAHVTRPAMELRGFKRLTLAPGETAKVTFRLDTKQMGYYNENMDFVVEPGQLTVMVGDSSYNLPLREEVELTGSAVNVVGRRVYTCPAEVSR